MFSPDDLVTLLASQPRDQIARKRVVGWGIAITAALLIAAAIAWGLGVAAQVQDWKDLGVALGAGAGLAIAFLGRVVASFERVAQSVKLEAVEQRVREHPEKPQFAWDLARTKLESYLDRNLSQVRGIFWLTLIVMVAGFCLIVYGLEQSFANPNTLKVSIVASASGVLISFIGGSFLLIYKAILAQSQGYVSVLERINAVGMAVQVLSNISDESIGIRDKSTADLSKQLLAMYATTPTAVRVSRRAASRVE